MHAIQYLPSFHIKPFVFFFSVTFHIFHISPFQQRPETMLLLPHDLGLVLILRVPSTGADSHFISIQGMCSRDLTNKQSIGTWEGTLAVLGSLGETRL